MHVSRLCEVAIGPISNCLVLSHRRCLYQIWVLIRFWRKNRVPRSGITMTRVHSPLHTRENLLVVERVDEVVGSLWGVCLKSEYGHPCGDLKLSYTQNIMPCGHPPEFVAGIAQQQQPIVQYRPSLICYSMLLFNLF